MIKLEGKSSEIKNDKFHDKLESLFKDKHVFTKKDGDKILIMLNGTLIACENLVLYDKDDEEYIEEKEKYLKFEKELIEIISKYPNKKISKSLINIFDSGESK